MTSLPLSLNSINLIFKMMITAIDLSLDKIRQFYHKWHVKEFALFGSIPRSNFHPDCDIDILIEFAPQIIYAM
ncbi:nucleotidyltransferase domain-containing protein [Synechocystis salina]|uniref:nucleotidyltransferase domain-containing protein n=1 Tax=Synechocystis salina TaxID=945780 RepID=UPI002AD47303|nr:nucleotidyltransferase domain-containing protein [Synechocystis salina]